MPGTAQRSRPLQAWARHGVFFAMAEMLCLNADPHLLRIVAVAGVAAVALLDVELLRVAVGRVGARRVLARLALAAAADGHSP